MLEGVVLAVGVSTQQSDRLPPGLEQPVDHLGALVGPRCLGADLPQGLALGRLEDVH